MAKAWLDLYAQFTDLSEEDKRQLFEAIKNDVSAEPKSSLAYMKAFENHVFGTV